MSTKSKSVAVSKLAYYAENPKGFFTAKANQDAIAYGNKAHARIGKGPSLALYVIVAMIVLWLFLSGRMPW